MIYFDELKDFGCMTKKVFSDLKEELYSRFEKLNGIFSSINEVSKPEEKPSKGVEFIEPNSSQKEEIEYIKQPIFTEKSDETDKKTWLDIDFTEEKALQAIVYSEILGEPKAKRRRRW